MNYKVQEEYEQLNKRTASILVLDGTLDISTNAKTTNFGAYVVGYKYEGWPYFDGKPLPFICQFNLTEAPFIPEILKDIKLITFFANHESYELGSDNGQGWCLRAYRELTDLYPLQIPQGCSLQKKTGAYWGAYHQDMPSIDDDQRKNPAGYEFTQDELDYLDENYFPIGETKIGGYCCHIQDLPWWDSKRNEHLDLYYKNLDITFCLQIGSYLELDLLWGDMGIVNIARGNKQYSKDQWFLDWSFH